MRLQMLLPKVNPKEMSEPSRCIDEGCSSRRVVLHQLVKKAWRDTVHQEVEVHRYRCLKCKRTFRVSVKHTPQIE